MSGQPKVPLPRCPRCRSTSFTAFAAELCEFSAPVVNGEAVEPYSSSALPERISCHGKCRCGHVWRFKDKWAIM
jgi:hypothetical protein